MLERKTTADGLVFYVSPLLRNLKTPHAFSTRLGGCSPSPFHSLNLGNPGGADLQDDPDQIARNYQRLLRAIDGPGDATLKVDQVHGCGVYEVETGQPPAPHPQADAIVSSDPARAVSVRIADCVPILLAGDDGRTVAAVHAGWRGLVAGVVPAAVKRLLMRGRPGQPRSIVAAIGPCIGPEAFEVGAEVLEEFDRILGKRAPVRRRANGKGFVDLKAVARLQLMDLGVERIDCSDLCTFAREDEFFSHRRDHGITGRMAAVIAARG